jgi:hypothetical protein
MHIVFVLQGLAQTCPIIKRPAELQVASCVERLEVVEASVDVGGSLEPIALALIIFVQFFGRVEKQIGGFETLLIRCRA